MNIQILTTPDCSSCKMVEKYLDELGLDYSVIDVTENPEYLEKYPIFSAPGIVINGRLEFAGAPSKKELHRRLNELTH
jgi:glutaredoxin